MTPIKKCQQEFKEFNSLVKGKLLRVQLNKSKPKDIPYPYARNGKYHTKGVLSDCILIYHNNDVSVAFAFNTVKDIDYINITSKNNTDEIKQSVMISLAQFKNYLKEVNKELKDLDFKTSKNLVDYIFDKSCKLEHNLYPSIKEDCYKKIYILFKEAKPKKRFDKMHDFRIKIRENITDNFPLFIVRESLEKLDDNLHLELNDYDIYNMLKMM